MSSTCFCTVQKMITRCFRFLITTVFTLSLSFYLQAQTDIRFQRITVDEGLSQSSITCMIQDKFGYLWIGTLDGLNKYDGNTFTIYGNDYKPNSLKARSVSGLFLDHLERLWISYRNGISLYNPVTNNFRNYPLLVDPKKNLFVRDFKPVSDSIIIICTNQGIFDFNIFTGSVTPAQAYLHFTGKNVSSIINTKGNYNWLATDSVLWRQQKDNSEWYVFFQPGGRLKASYFEQTNELYVRTERKVWKHDPITDALKVIDDVAPGQWPNSQTMLKTQSGDLWVAHGEITIFNRNDMVKNRLHHVSQDPNSLSGAFVSGIYETRDGVIWVGTNGLGLNKYDPYRSMFSYIGRFPGAEITLSDGYVTSVYTDDDRNILVNTLDGLNAINLQQRKSHHFAVTGRDGKPGQIQKVFKDAKGRLWLATTKGLMRFESNALRPSGNRLLDDPTLTVYDAISISKSTFLLATNQSIILWNLDEGSTKEILPFGSLVLQKVNNDYWIESKERITVLSLDNQSIIKTFPLNGSDSLHAPLASLKCIYQDRNKNIWVGTDGGGFSLYDSTTRTFRHFTNRDGLLNNVVYGILEDNLGNLWMSTNKGLSVFNPSTFSFIRHFNKTDGLQGNEFNTRAYFQSLSGKLYFGGINGLSFFDPNQILQIPLSAPKTVLTGFYINNIRQEQGSNSKAATLFSEHNIRLNWDERNFAFDIAGLGFTFPSGVQYKYKLDGFDKTWNVIGNHGRINFTNMAAGSYTLHARSGNSGYWEQEGLIIHIRIVSPFWKTGWFIAGIITSVIILIALFYDQRVRYLKRRAVLLQTLVEERTREIQLQREEIAAQNEELSAQTETLENTNQELEQRVERRTSRLRQLNEELIDQNTQLEQFAFITAHNIRGPIARIRGLIRLLGTDDLTEIVKYLEVSVNNLDEVIADLNTILSITNTVDKKFELELVSVKEQLTIVLKLIDNEIQSLNATLDISGFENVKVLGLKPYFQSIFYNLVHNALKYSDPLRSPVITCYTQQTQDRILIVVEDNGIGIDMRYAKDKIFKLHQRFHTNTTGRGIGLYLVKTQVKVMRGRINVESEVNVGTRFIIDLPKPTDDGTQPSAD